MLEKNPLNAEKADAIINIEEYCHAEKKSLENNNLARGTFSNISIVQLPINSRLYISYIFLKNHFCPLNQILELQIDSMPAQKLN